MLQERVDVLQEGDESGNNMMIRLKLPSGREIFGLPTENSYNGDFTLGPTWNYVVGSENPLLVDTGRPGMGGKLLELLGKAGIEGKDVKFILLSHGHEDHDGGLSEIVQSTGARVKAHAVYARLIRYYPEGPSNGKGGFPASCWHCAMPESFSQSHCLEYHRQRSGLKIEAVEDSESPAKGISLYHVPGHSPDSLAIMVDGEAILVSDTLLPDITPHPTREEYFKLTRAILQPRYAEAQSLYGLRAYIRSLKRLGEIGTRFPNILVLPGHRLFYSNKWNGIELKRRVDELIEHHIQRCAEIIKIVKGTPKTALEIAGEYFETRLLKGYGSRLAVNEVLSHCELLRLSQDILFTEDDKILASGSTSFESFIDGI